MYKNELLLSQMYHCTFTISTQIWLIYHIAAVKVREKILNEKVSKMLTGSVFRLIPMNTIY